MKKQLLIALLAVFSLGACKKNDEKPKYALDKTELSLHFDEEHQFAVKEGNKEVSGLTWSSSDETVGTVSSSGLFEAKKIGKTTIKATGNGKEASCEVTVSPYSTMFVEPVLDFGASISAVKGKEKRELSGETSTGLIYKGENSKVRNVMYVFKDGKLSTSALLIGNSTSVIEESVKFFSERYTYLGDSDGYYLFTNGGKLNIILTYDLSLGYTAMYFESSSIASVSSYKDAYTVQLERLRNAVNNF